MAAGPVAPITLAVSELHEADQTLLGGHVIDLASAAYAAWVPEVENGGHPRQAARQLAASRKNKPAVKGACL